MWTLKPTYPMNTINADFIMNTNPPTLYAIMNSIANYNSETETKIRNLAKATHNKIFDFDYPLSSAMSKEDFECQILNHYIMRRINFDTFNAFQIYLENKLNEILPFYNKLFDSLNDFNLFNDGEKITRNLTENGTSSLNSTNDIESRMSEYPLGQLSDINDGNYVSTQNLSNGSSVNNGATNNNTVETINRSPIDKMDLYQKYLETKSSIMTMIYKDLDILFYGIVD